MTAGVITGAMAATGISPVPAAAASRVTLNVLMLAGSSTTIITQMAPEFESKYGINVNITSAPYNSMHLKEVEDFASHSDRYDVIESDNPWLEEYAPDGWELNLSPYLAKAGYPVTSRLVNGQTVLSMDDMIPNVLNDYGNYGGRLYALPWMPGAQLLFYRKDLFANKANQALFAKEYGYPLAPPKTLTQLYDVAKFFTNKAKHMYGLTWSGANGNESENDWEEILWAMGGDIFPFGQGFPSTSHPLMDMPIVDNPISLAALRYFDSLKAFMPPGAGSFGWAEITPTYTSGDAAMMIQWSDFVTSIASSPYKNDTGFEQLPGDPQAPKVNLPGIVPGKGYSSLGGWAIAINSATKHPNSAMKFVLWATGLTMTPGQRLHYENAAFTGFGTVSSYSNPATLGYKLGGFMPTLTALETGVRRRPEVGAGLSVQTIIGDQANDAFVGAETPQAALSKMQSELFSLMQSKGFIPGSAKYQWPSQYVNRNGTPA
ncbi:MAG: ABC transporter substrate-binding protein [Acidimicrobiales bacterium]